MLFVLVACLLSTVSGASNFCCTPPQWEGSMGVIVGSMSSNGTGALTEGTMKISYDGVNRMVTTQQSLMVNGQPLLQTVVDDYKAGASYTMKSDGSCVRGILGAWTPNCIPANATQAHWYYGLGDDTVNVNGYHVDYGTFEVYFAVTADTCVPVVEDVLGIFNGAKIFEVMTFANIEAGIQDRMVFNIPSRCLTAPVVQVPGIATKRSSPFR